MNDLSAYTCTNGAYHAYTCCDTCWNNHPIAKRHGGMFTPEFRQFLRDIMRTAKVIEHINAGFTFEQALVLTKGN